MGLRLITAAPDYFLIFLITFFFFEKIRLLLLNMSCPVLANSVDPDQLASEDLDLHCLLLNMWISIKNPDQVI